MFRAAASVLFVSVVLAPAACSQSSGSEPAGSTSAESAQPSASGAPPAAGAAPAAAPTPPDPANTAAPSAPSGADPASLDRAPQANGATPIANAPIANTPGANTPIANPPGAADMPGASGAAEPAAEPPSAASATCNVEGAARAETPTVWVIGDSTASRYASDLYPRMGWAQPLQDYFASACARVEDRALSGRSSKSFLDEGAWTPVRDALKAGDFVLIQFGHNDEKSEDPLRFTDPFTTFQEHLSVYIDDARARGAAPILLTPINRNRWQGATLSDTHGQYPEAMRQLAAARGVPLVDATLLTKTYFERIGEAATTQLFLVLAPGQFPNYPDGNTDNTHLQETGARTIAQIVLADLARQQLPLGGLVKAVAVAP